MRRRVGMKLWAVALLLGIWGCRDVGESPAPTASPADLTGTQHPGGEGTEPTATVAAPETPAATATVDDCPQRDEHTFPGNPEVCDGIDNNCDGIIPPTERDQDGDGVRVCDGDCDDGDVNRYPGATEACDGVDNDCDNAVPDDEQDKDQDGHRACADDCDDSDRDTYTGAAEICDGEDNDCDGALGPKELDGDGDGFTECDGDCAPDDPQRYPTAAEVCDGLDDNCDRVVPSDEKDNDRDGVLVCAGDCIDSNANVAPGLAERCDGIDNNCNGLIDEAEPDDDGHAYGLTGAVSSLPRRGGTGGFQTNVDCACGAVAVGIKADVVNWAGLASISRYSLTCERLATQGLTGEITQTAVMGNLQGTPFDLQCPHGEILIGLDIDSGTRIIGLGGHCATLESVLADEVTVSTSLPKQVQEGALSEGATPYSDTCPAGMVIKGSDLRSAEILDALGGRCQALSLY